MPNDTRTDLSIGQESGHKFELNTASLKPLGLTDERFAHWHHLRHGKGGLARVLSAHRGRWLVAGHLPGGGTLDGEGRGLEARMASAAISGRLLAAGHLPVTGDWVTLRSQDVLSSGSESLEIIDAILPRTSWISREAAGGTREEQLLAANVDIVLCVMAMGQNYNLSRMERYLSLAWEAGAQPIVVITKVDTEEVDAAVQLEVEAIAQGVPCIFCSSVTAQGLDEFEALLPAGKTAVLIGSSGAGKSTLLNALAGQVFMATGQISELVGKGRHTTVSRELFALTSGALIIDTPGMRELALVCDAASVDSTFTEVEALAERCRFIDCSHSGEPGCAVQAAVDEGSIDDRRLKSWHKQRRESARQQSLARMAERRGKPRSLKRDGTWKREAWDDLDQN